MSNRRREYYDYYESFNDDVSHEENECIKNAEGGWKVCFCLEEFN